MMRVLRGDGVILEPQLEGHAAELYAVLADPLLYTFIDDKGPSSEEALRARLKRLESRLSPDGTQQWLNWVVRSDADEAVGYVQATVLPDHTAEVAYVIGRAFWRLGYATAAMRPMLAELKGAYGVHRATATLDPRNAASLALLEKLGFRFAGADEAANEISYGLDL
jgi:ribosomal-protein-alanine N-acetyltransferase